MLPWSGPVIAHPASGHPHVDVPVVLVVALALLLPVSAALAVPPRRPAGGVPRGEEWSFTARLTVARLVVRLLAVALMTVAVVAGRAGVDDELENLAPALLVGSAWPLLALVSCLLGPVWRWLDPWDTLGRIAGPDRTSDPPGQVWPAVVVGLAMTWFLSAWPEPLSVRAVGTAAALYAIVMVTGCVALGRARWLGSADPLGITLTWMALLPRRRLAGWAPPRGAEVLLGVLVGGLLFGLVRRSALWSGLSVLPGALLYSTAALLVLAGSLGVVLVLFGRMAERWQARPIVARAAVPALAGVIVAVGLERSRFLNSLQLLPGLLGDPFGRGWDLFGPAVAGLDPAPVGPAGLVGLQLGLVLLGCVLGAAASTREVERGDPRMPAALASALVALTACSAIVLH